MHYHAQDVIFDDEGNVVEVLGPFTTDSREDAVKWAKAHNEAAYLIHKMSHGEDAKPPYLQLFIDSVGEEDEEGVISQWEFIFTDGSGKSVTTVTACDREMFTAEITPDNLTAILNALGIGITLTGSSPLESPN